MRTKDEQEKGCPRASQGVFQERGGKPQKGCPRKEGESIRGGPRKGGKASQRDGPGGEGEASERDLVPEH